MILKTFHDSKYFKTEVFALIFLTFLESFFGQPINNNNKYDNTEIVNLCLRPC